MRVREFYSHRAAELNDFFRGRFGLHWKRITSNRLGLRFIPPFFHDSRRLRSLETLSRVESLAESLGFKPSNPDLVTFERKRRERLTSIVDSIKLVLNLDTIPYDRLCAMAYYKTRHPSTKDDVFSSDYLANWVDDAGMLNPCSQPEQPEGPGQSTSSAVQAEVSIGADQSGLPPGTNRGVEDPPARSLSGPSAISKLSREQLKVVARESIKLLAKDRRAGRKERMHYLACLQRLAEKLLMEQELIEQGR